MMPTDKIHAGRPNIDCLRLLPHLGNMEIYCYTKSQIKIRFRNSTFLLYRGKMPWQFSLLYKLPWRKLLYARVQRNPFPMPVGTSARFDKAMDFQILL